MSNNASSPGVGSSGAAQVTEAAVANFTHASLVLRQAPGKGLGMFATSGIPPGTKIVVEVPLAVMGQHDDHDEVLNNLNTTDRCALLQLYPGPHAPLATIWTSNSFSTNIGSALYKTTCRFNHSCTPNINAELSHTGQATLQTTRAIAAGEELTISYRGDFDVMTARERAVDIAAVWGFTCDCPACIPSGRLLSDLRRQLIRGIILKLGTIYSDGAKTSIAPAQFVHLHHTAWEKMGRPGMPGGQLFKDPESWFVLGCLLIAEGLRDGMTLYAYKKALEMLKERVGTRFTRAALVLMLNYASATLESYALYPEQYHQEKHALKAEQAEYGSMLGYVEFVGQGDMD